VIGINKVSIYAVLETSSLHFSKVKFIFNNDTWVK